MVIEFNHQDETHMQHSLSSYRHSVFPTFMQSLHYAIMALALFIATVLFGAIPGYVPPVALRVDQTLLHIVAYAFLSTLVYFSLADSPVRRALKAVGIVGVLAAVDKLLQSQVFHSHSVEVDWLGCMAAAVISVITLTLIQIFRVARTRRQAGHA